MRKIASGLEKLRMIKRPEEIEYIRAAAKLTDRCFDFILGKIKPGMTENDIAWEIESFFRTRGAGTAFSPIVAFGKNTSHILSITGISREIGVGKMRADTSGL